ncbi:hypothetical protein [Micromonospora sp. HUAS LYJ1]|uniref:hypothetical protein n=1 Tax=Micromonospora sp. HUAS LYJ1 TaxID=3061626 RepID=UPI0026726664|nr:hypothetical protein [Micromonospora sp. HUAS LYJ1]WKU03769.1 hypothetical protein Q2K16_23435 [Micromonospora sp. HUAS LYJ1]
MTTTHRVRGEVPPDSPLKALAGRTVTMPAESLEQLAGRVREMRQARIDPVVLPARRIPWTPIAVALTASIIADVIAAILAIINGSELVAGIAAAGMVLAGITLFPVLTHLEMDR